MKTSVVRAHVPQRANGAAFDENRRPTAVRDDGDEQDPSLVSATVAKHMLALIELMLPRIVGETFALYRREDERLRRHGEVQRAARLAEKKLNSKQIAAALGCGLWVVSAVKKANRLAFERGEEPLIFSGRYSSPERVSAWLDAHPKFIARHVLVSPDREQAYRQREFELRRQRRTKKRGAS